MLASAIAMHDVELILADCDGPSLEKARGELQAQGMFCDTQSMSSVEIFEAQFRERFDSLHMLVNAAERGHSRILATIRMSTVLLPVLRRTPGTKAIVNVATDEDAGTSFPLHYSCRPEATTHYSSHLQAMVKGSAISVATIRHKGTHSLDKHFRAISPLLARVIADAYPDIGEGERHHAHRRSPPGSSFFLCERPRPLRRA